MKQVIKDHLREFPMLFFSKFCLITITLGIGNNLFSQSDLGEYEVHSDATDLGGGCVELTTENRSQIGTMWFSNLFDLQQDFDVRVQMNFGDHFCWQTCADDPNGIYPEHRGGADGIAFVMQQQSTNAGSSGGGIGYKGISPSVAFEFDTYFNFGDDPLYDHIAMAVNGDVSIGNRMCPGSTNPQNHWAVENLCNEMSAGNTNRRGGINNTDLMVPAVGTDPSIQTENLQDGEDHEARFVWDFDTKTFEVWLDCKLKISVTEDFIQTVFGWDPKVFIGFTSSTGSEMNLHNVCVNTLKPSYEPLEDESICLGENVLLDANNSISNPSTEPTYLWSVIEGDVSSLLTANSASINVTPNKTTTYALEAYPSCYTTEKSPTNLEGDSPFYDTITVEVIKTVEISPAEIICSNDNTTYTVTFQVFGEDAENFTFVGTGTPGTIETNQVVRFTTDPISSDSPYNLTITASTGGCNPLTINGQADCDPQCTIFPNVNAGNDQKVCGENLVSLSGAEAFDVVSKLNLIDTTRIEWKHTGSGSLSFNSIIDPIYTPAVEDQGNTISFILIGYSGSMDTIGCPNSYDTLEIDVALPPEVNAGISDTICLNEVFQVSSTVVQNTSGVKWFHNGLGGLSPDTSLTPIYSPVKGDIYHENIELVLMGIGIAPCSNTYDTINIKVDGVADADAGIDGLICEETSFDVDQSFVIGESYSWKHTGSGELNDSSLLQPTYISAQEDAGKKIELILTSIGGENCPIAMDTLEIEIAEKATIEAGNDSEICGLDFYTVEGSSIENTSNFLWSHDGKGTIENSTSISPTYHPGVGNYENTVTLFLVAVSNSPCLIVTDSIKILVRNPGQILLGEEMKTCLGTPAIIDVIHANSDDITWTHTGNGSLDTQEIDHINYQGVAKDNGASIDVIATLKVNDVCPEVRDTFSIIVLQPIVVDAGTAPDICVSGTSSIIDATVSNNGRYEWTHTGAGVLQNENSLTPIYKPGVTDLNKDIVFTLLAFPDSLCPVVSDTLSLNVIGNPFVNAGKDQEICYPELIQIKSLEATGYSDLSWKLIGMGNLETSNPFNLNYQPEKNDQGKELTFVVTAKGVAPCETVFDSIVVKVETPPSVEAGIGDLICFKDEFTVASAFTENTESVSWTHNGSGVLINETTLTPLYSPSPADANTIIVLNLEGFGKMGCESVKDSIQIEIVGDAQAYAGDPSIVCFNSEHTIENAKISGAISHIWTHTGLGKLENKDGLTPIYFPSENEIGDTVKLMLIAYSKAPCDSSHSITELIISPTPKIEAGENDTICFGDNYSLIDAIGENYSAIYWTHTGNGTIENNGTLKPTYVPNEKDMGKTVRLIIEVEALQPCIDVAIDFKEIYIQSPPTLNIEKTGGICIGESNDLIAISSNHSNLLWELEQGEGLLSPTSDGVSSYTAAANDAGKSIQTKVTAVGIGTCPSEVMKMSFRVGQQPVVNAGSDSSICINNVYQLNGNAENISEFIWSHNGCGTFENESSLTPTYRPCWEDRNQTVTIVLSGKPNLPCQQEVESSIYLRIISNPEIYAGEDRSMCAGEEMFFDNANAQNEHSIEWEVLEGKVESLENPGTISPTYQSSESEGGSSVTLIAKALPILPCLSIATDTIVIEWEIIPKYEIEGGIVCPGESFTMKIDPINEYSVKDYKWFNDSISGENKYEGEEWTISPILEVEKYWVEPAYGCKGERIPVIVKLAPLPIADFVADTSVIGDLNSEITFFDQSTGAVSGSWNFGDGETELYSKSGEITHSYSIDPKNIPENIVIKLNVKNEFGCEDKQIVILPVELKWGIYIPNAFTPNSDDVNPEFNAIAYGLVSYEMRIFNRWGDNIYYSNDLKKGWDGRDHLLKYHKTTGTDETRKMDMYVYRIDIVTIFGEVYTYKGDVHLIR